MTPSDTEIFVFFTYLIKGNKIDPKMPLKYFEKKFWKKIHKNAWINAEKNAGNDCPRIAGNDPTKLLSEMFLI